MGKRGMNPQQAAKIRHLKGLPSTTLQKWRVKRGLSQNDLADASGVSARKIRGFEQREKPIDKAELETLCDLSETLGCKIEDLLEDKELLEKYKRYK